jgi:hypothetical protein
LGGTENGNGFLYGLSTHYIPYSTRSEISSGGANGVLSGTIAQGAGSLNVQIPLIAKEFGSSWVHLVAHSKGGLNARYLIGAHWLDSQGIGVLSLTTLDTPHLGALGAVIINQRARNHLLDVPGQPVVTATLNLVARKQANDDENYKTIGDLTPDQVYANLNNLGGDFTLPPATITVNGLEEYLKVRALASDANVDGSTLHGGPDVVNNLDWRTISVSEGRNLTGFFGQGIDAPEVMYNANGRMTGVQPNGQTRSDSNGKPIIIINPVYSQSFLWNDCVVTTNSQMYAAPFLAFLPFQPLTPTAIAKGTPYGNNHVSVSNSAIAGLVASFLSSITY